MTAKAEPRPGVGRAVLFAGLLVAPVLLWGACRQPDQLVRKEKIRRVRTLAMQPENHPRHLDYIGHTSSQAIKKYSFKVPGRIRAIDVEKGQVIRRGQRLAQLDTTELNFSLAAARLTQDKAQQAFDEAKKFFSKIERLYQQKVQTQVDFDRAKLKLQVSQADLDQAQVDVQYKQSMLGDARMISEVDGFVVEVLNRVGEIVAAGYPVVVVRNNRQVVTVGVSQRDIKQIRLGTQALLNVDGAKGEGQVTQIAQVPDPRSRTYEVEIELSGRLLEQNFYLGSITKVAFVMAPSQGLWVPIQALLTDGVDYVFVVENGRALRKNVQLGEISEVRVRVDGLETGDQVIVEGMKNLKEGYRVAAQPVAAHKIEAPLSAQQADTERAQPDPKKRPAPTPKQAGKQP